MQGGEGGVAEARGSGGGEWKRTMTALTELRSRGYDYQSYYSQFTFARLLSVPLLQDKALPLREHREDLKFETWI